jgi:hypothetical protein
MKGKELALILVRQVFQGKFGKAGELAAVLQEANLALAREVGMGQGWRALTGRGWRIMTDLSGPFDSFVLELEVESLAEWERIRRETFSSAKFRNSFARATEMVDSGRSELYTIVVQG